MKAIMTGTMVIFIVGAATGVNPTVTVDNVRVEAFRETPELAWHVLFGAAEDDCSVTCWDQHQAGAHVAHGVGSWNERGAGSHTDPFNGSCADKHPGCGGGDVEMIAALAKSVEHGDAIALHAILNRGTADVYFAAERHAIQVLGCHGEVIAHFVVDDEMRTLIAGALPKAEEAVTAAGIQ